MKSFLLCNNDGILIGMRLSGIEGKIVKNKEELNRELYNLSKDIEIGIGIIMITEEVVNYSREEIMEFRLENTTPLIVEIPGKDGFKEKNRITKYIKESIGIEI